MYKPFYNYWCPKEQWFKMDTIDSVKLYPGIVEGSNNPAYPLSGNAMIMGTEKSGKTTLLTSLFIQMCTRYSPYALHIPAADFSESTFSKVVTDGNQVSVPHLRIVCGSTSQDVQWFVSYLNQLTEGRKRLLEDYNKSSIQDYNRLPSRGMLPRIVIMVDNLHLIREGLEELPDIVARCDRLGIHFIFTASTYTPVIRDLLPLCQLRFGLGMPAEVSDAFMRNTVCAGLPGKHGYVVCNITRSEAVQIVKTPYLSPERVWDKDLLDKRKQEKAVPPYATTIIEDINKYAKKAT